MSLKKLPENKEENSVPQITNKTQAALEIKRCKSDPVFFAKNHIYIKHPKRGQVRFALYPFQEQVIRDFQKHRFNVILKSRQLGLTELIATYILWYCIFHKDKNVLVISKNREAASNLIKRIKYSYKKLPEWLKITKFETNNVFSLEFDNDSRIFAAASTNDAGRSEACSLLVVDEAAFIPGLEEAWASLFPVISTGGEAIVNSTPYGSSGQFYDLFKHAPSNNFNPIILNWDVHPERNQEWFERTRQSMNLKKFSREFLCSFELSGDTILDPEDITKSKTYISEPIEKLGLGKNLWIWKRFNPEHRYLMAADAARGDGTDYSTFVVIDVDAKEIVCEYQEKIKVDKFAKLMYEVGTQMYGSCLLVVENNNMGLAVLMKLIDLKYPNLYWEQKGTHSFREGFVDFDDNDVIPGFTTTMSTKILVIEKFEEYVRTGKIITHSSRMAHEFENFVYINGKPKAREGANDDLIMAFAIGAFITDMLFSTRREDAELKLGLLSRITSIENSISSQVPAEKGYNPAKSPYIIDKNDPYKANLAGNVSVDFRMFMNKPKQSESNKQPPSSFITFLGMIK